MKRNSTLTSAAILLMLLGIYMIYLGTDRKMLPPTLTGIGFIIIAMAFLGLRSR